MPLETIHLLMWLRKCALTFVPFPLGLEELDALLGLLKEGILSTNDRLQGGEEMLGEDASEPHTSLDAKSTQRPPRSRDSELQVEVPTQAQPLLPVCKEL